MRVVLQRVEKACVSVDGEILDRIGRGMVLLLGIAPEDTEKEADYLAEKCANLRIFEDEGGKMNLSAMDVEGEALVISQFTLYGDCRKGRRPSFTDAASPEEAIPLYEYFIKRLHNNGIPVSSGRFGAKMVVEIWNDGPVTLIIESH